MHGLVLSIKAMHEKLKDNSICLKKELTSSYR